MDCSFKTIMTNLISIECKMKKKTKDSTYIQKIIGFVCIYIYIICKHTIINYVQSLIANKGKR